MPIEPPILADLPTEIETERLLLRTPRAGDSAFVWPAVEASLAELSRWMPWAYPSTNRENVETFCRRAAADFIRRDGFHFAIDLRGTQTCVGVCGTARLAWGVPMIEIGYWLRTTEYGKGYMTEAARAVTRYCFDRLSMKRVEIRCDVRNARSRGVAERAGFTLEGILRNSDRDVLGNLRDSCVYAHLPRNADEPV